MHSLLYLPPYSTAILSYNRPFVMDRTGQDRTGQDRTGQDRTGQDRTDKCV
ncbi:hypothetical protein [Candidatus Nitrosocosmicus sp. R]